MESRGYPESAKWQEHTSLIMARCRDGEGHCPIPSPLWEQEEACVSLRSRKKLVAEDAAAPPQTSWPSWRRKSVYVVKKAKLFHLICWLYLYNSLYNKLCVGLKGRGKNYVCIITKLHIHKFLIQFQATADQKYSSGKRNPRKIQKTKLEFVMCWALCQIHANEVMCRHTLL